MTRDFIDRLIVAIILLGLATAASGQQRIALVIGNGGYLEAPLDNPVRDATDVSARLEELGFEVIAATDADLATMQQQLVSFVERIKSGATAMVYYAGHGIQANGRNYLLPVDASADNERALRFEALEVADILEELEGSDSRMNLLVLDACRNNPFEKKVRGGSRGLAVMDASAGSLIAYATAPGSVASDGDGENGLYTAAFLEALQLPGLKVEEVFKQVRIRVSDASRGQQIPWESSSLTADFVFNPGAAAEVASAMAKSEPAPQRETESICGDLSGRWVSRNEVLTCASEFSLRKTGPGTYDMAMLACNVPVMREINGKTVLDGSTLTTRWKGAACSGVTAMTLSESCRSGEGAAVLDASLLCKGTVKETIHFLGAEP